MKKKILVILTTILTLCVSAFALTACGEEEPTHTHKFDQQEISDTYKAKDAVCEGKAEYYFSCSCGEKGTETFEFGEPLEHSFTNYVYNNDAKCEQDGTETALCDHNCGKDHTRTN